MCALGPETLHCLYFEPTEVEYLMSPTFATYVERVEDAPRTFRSGYIFAPDHGPVGWELCTSPGGRTHDAPGCRCSWEAWEPDGEVNE